MGAFDVLGDCEGAAEGRRVEGDFDGVRDGVIEGRREEGALVGECDVNEFTGDIEGRRVGDAEGLLLGP